MMETEWFLPILLNRREGCLRSVKNWVSQNLNDKKFGNKIQIPEQKLYICNHSFKFQNWWNMTLTRANLEISATQNLKFSKFDLTSWFHLFF